MGTKSPLKSGFLDRIYIPNHPVPSSRKRDRGKIVPSSAVLAGAIYYAEIRIQDVAGLLPNSNNSGDLVDPEKSIEEHLGYTQFRPQMDGNGSPSSPKRPIWDYGLGSEPQQIIDFCKIHATPQLLAQTFVISIHPKFNAILEKHGIDPNAFTAEYAIKFLREWYDYCGWGGDVEAALVMHFELDKAGDPHYHAHTITPGTGYDAAKDQRIPVPVFTPVRLLQAGHNIADRVALEEMDRVLTRSWRLEIPEMMNTFYDPGDLPIPESSSVLDSWFPRPPIPKEALIPPPEPPSFGDQFSRNDLWEPADSFGETEEMVLLVDKLFADLTFDLPLQNANLVTIFGPDLDAKTTDEGNSLAPSEPDIPISHTNKSEADDLSDERNQLESDISFEDEIVNPSTSKRDEIRAKRRELIRQIEEESLRSFEEIAQDFWPKIGNPETIASDGKTEEIAAQIGALFPIPIWEAADDFGDDNIIQQIDELFGESYFDPQNSIEFIDALPDITSQIPDFDTEIEANIPPQLNWHEFKENNRIIRVALGSRWDDLHAQGYIFAHVEWALLTAQMSGTCESGIYQTSVADHLFFEPTLYFDDAKADAITALDTQLTALDSNFDDDFDKGMSNLYKSWFETMVLDDEAIQDGFLPGLPQSFMLFDEYDIDKESERLPGVKWIHDEVIDTDLGLTFSLPEVDGQEIYSLEFLTRRVDKMGIQQIEIVETNVIPDVNTIEGAAQRLFDMAQGMEYEFATNPDDAHSKWGAALEPQLDLEPEQILDETVDADDEDELSEIEWEDDEFYDYGEGGIDM